MCCSKTCFHKQLTSPSAFEKFEWLRASRSHWKPHFSETAPRSRSTMHSPEYKHGIGCIGSTSTRLSGLQLLSASSNASTLRDWRSVRSVSTCKHSSRVCHDFHHDFHHAWRFTKPPRSCEEMWGRKSRRHLVMQKLVKLLSDSWLIDCPAMPCHALPPVSAMMQLLPCGNDNDVFENQTLSTRMLTLLT